MTPEQIEIAVCGFVAALYPSAPVVRRLAVVTMTPPYVTVEMITDIPVGQADQIPDADGAVAYRQQHRARVVIEAVGTDAATAIVQRVAMMWRADCAPRNALLAAGLATAGGGEVAVRRHQRQAGPTLAASVSLLGYHSVLLRDQTAPYLQADEIDGTLTVRSAGETPIVIDIDIDIDENGNPDPPHGPGPGGGGGGGGGG